MPKDTPTLSYYIGLCSVKENDKTMTPLALSFITKLPERWKNLSSMLEQEKALVPWASEQYLCHCAVQVTLERCAEELEAAIDKARGVSR